MLTYKHYTINIVMTFQIMYGIEMKMKFKLVDKWEQDFSL